MSKLALLFPGQGSQYVKMGKSLYDHFESARKTFDEADEVLNLELKKLCFEGDMEELTLTRNAQPAILTASVAAFRVYMEQVGILPVCAGGHSLGEYSALVCSGAVSFPDALRIVRQRGIFMQEAADSLGTGAMAAVMGLDKEILETECQKISKDEQIVVVSNYNSPVQTVISGHKEAVEAAGNRFREMGGTVTPLKVSAPFHSPLMEPAADKLKAELSKYTYSSFKFPVVSNVTAHPYENEQKIIENLTVQLIAPVQWVASMKYVENAGVNIAVEIGPQTVLRNLMKKNVPGIKAYSFDKSEDTEALQKEIKANISGGNSNGPTVVTRCMAIAVCTRNRNWNNEEYQKGVVEPYRNMEKMQEEIEKSGAGPTLEQMKEALSILGLIFATKKTPAEEQAERYNQIFDETGTRQLFSDFKMPV